VIDNGDPELQHRLLVTVPDVDPTTVWAPAASSEGDDGSMPAVGDEVWIEYEQGDAAHPRWVGNT
jgi:hypothetical protein